jgi:selenocysteine lyase/cysteine desulfurase
MVRPVHAADPEAVARYFDHGATSFAKPAVVARAMAAYLDGCGGTYGRAAYPRAHDATALVFDARERLARLLGVADSSRVVFTLNATHALNIAIQGLTRPGGTVLVSPLEHNAVMRPLTMMCRRHGARIEVLPHRADGRVEPERLAVPAGACLAVVALQGNVNGVIQPVAAIRERLGGVPLLVDAAQGAGEVPIDAGADGLDLVAVTGHKALLGPTGTGALYVRPGLDLPSLLPGGTGSRSESVEQPSLMPDALEGGTLNVAGIVGLGAALEWLAGQPPARTAGLAVAAAAALRRIPGVMVHGALVPGDQGGLLSFEIGGLSGSQTVLELLRRHGIEARAGLQCAPFAHRTLGTFERGGAVRIAFGRFHDDCAVELVTRAVADLAGRLG